MNRVKAWEMLEDPNYCGKLKMLELYKLLLRAGWSADEAQAVANQRGFERLGAGEEM